MTQISAEMLEKIVNEQEVSGLGLVTPDGKPHCTPVWVHHLKGKLYIFSRKSRAKVKYAKISGECMIAFDFASLRGDIELVERGDREYDEIYDLPDLRYGYNDRLQSYKENWDVALKITPTRLYR